MAPFTTSGRSGILRGMHGDRPFFELLASTTLADESSIHASPPTSPVFDADASRLTANWNPTSLEQIVEADSFIGETPLKSMKPLAVRVPKLPKRPSAG